MAAAIETKKLTKTYKSRALGKINVVNELDLHVEEGEIFGFLGPNGAGKTTTIKMLLGIIYPTFGEGYVLGREIGDMEVHRKISYLPERPYYYEHLTGYELLRFYDSLFGNHDAEKCQELLRRVNLAGDASKTINQYSKGMQQRIGLAQSLLNDPRLLFLDEPTGGLDPIAHREIRDLILSFRDEGRTVFISSHELSEVELICDRVAIIHKGEIARQGKLTELLKGGRIEITISGVPDTLAKQLATGGVLHQVADGYLLDMPEDEDVNAVVDAVRNASGKIVSMVPRKKRLEDLFVETVRAAKPSEAKITQEVAV
ncbi:MAG: type transport system ATP-binding protein [Fimbriimonadaceae bacterium]|nr:type transport system ATP-binding protein [Fimbriimonadaceae bacterium]